MYNIYIYILVYIQTCICMCVYNIYTTCIDITYTHIYTYLHIYTCNEIISIHMYCRHVGYGAL